jgi:hypothetical protein
MAMAVFAWGGCAPAIKMYSGPDRPKGQIATLILAAQQHGYLVRLDAVGRIESVRWFEDPGRDREWFSFLALPGIGDARATHVLRAARIDAVDGESVQYPVALYPASADGVGPFHDRRARWAAHGVIQALPGVREIRGTIPFPCGPEAGPKSHPFTVNVDAKPGRRYVIGWLQPIAPLTPRPSYQVVAIDIGDGDTSKALGYMRYEGPVVRRS